MAMLCFFHYLIFKNSFGLFVCLFVCLTVVGITESTESITVVSTAGVSTISAIVSTKTVSVGVGVTVVSGVEDSGISLSLSLTLLAGISHSGLLCGSRGSNKEGVVEAISVAISVSVGSSNMDYCRFAGHSSDGTGNMFSCFMFNGITDSGC